MSDSIETIMWGVAALSLFGTYLNIRHSRACFPIWLATYAFWIAYSVYKHSPAQTALFAAYAFLAVYGWCAWGGGRPVKKVARLTARR